MILNATRNPTSTIVLPIGATAGTIKLRRACNTAVAIAPRP